MAYNKRHVGFSRIIENVYRTSGYDDIDWESAVEWTSALMRIIGVPAAFVQKSTNGLDGNSLPIEISNYRGILPNDIVTRGSCRRIDINDNMEIYKFSAMQETTDLFFQTPGAESIDNPVFFDPYYNTVYIDENGESQPVTLTQSPSYYGTGDTFTYKIEGNIIFTNFKTGYVEMEYKGFAIDEDGLPAIPDDEKYIRAIVWEIIANTDRKTWRKNPSPQNKSIYNDSAQERDWAVSSARTKGRIPTVDELESIKNMWVRSIPKINEHATGFKTLGAQEVRYNQNNRT